MSSEVAMLIAFGLFVGFGLVVVLRGRPKRDDLISFSHATVWTQKSEPVASYAPNGDPVEALRAAKLALVNAQEYAMAAEVREITKRLQEKREATE